MGTVATLEGIYMEGVSGPLWQQWQFYVFLGLKW